jgi:ABC-type lipoprotein release transport system permease subunit
VIALLAFSSRALIARRRTELGSISRWAKPIAGALFLTIGLAVLSGFDKRVEAYLVERSPDWLIEFVTSI